MEQREFIVEQETAGQRIDRFLSGEDTGLSRSALQALVAEGHVQCNGKTVAKSLKLKAGDTVLLEIPDAKPIEAVPQEAPLRFSVDAAGRLRSSQPCAQLRLFNAAGQALDASAPLPRGVYVVQGIAQGTGKAQTQKLIVR